MIHIVEDHSSVTEHLEPEEHPENKELHQVDTILRHKTVRVKLQRWIKWDGYSSSENTWEPPENLERCSYLIEEYHRRKKEKRKSKKRGS
jgi:hypothetical protein